MKLSNTATGAFLGDYPGTVDEALDAYARDVGWHSWAQWVAEGRAPGGRARAGRRSRRGGAAMTAEDVMLAIEEHREEEARRRSREKGAKSDAATRARIMYFVTSTIVLRWEAAGFTTARLVDGLPRPERGHPGDWQGEGYARHCAVCARPWVRRGEPPPVCPGPPAFDLVHEAVERGVPFGLVDGLPMAGEPIALDGILVKVAAATVAKAA